MKRSKQLSTPEETKTSVGHPDSEAISNSSNKKSRNEPRAERAVGHKWKPSIDDRTVKKTSDVQQKVKEAPTSAEKPTAPGSEEGEAGGGSGGPRRHRSIEAHHRRRARAKENKKRKKILLKNL
jgi:hypothetical protein